MPSPIRRFVQCLVALACLWLPTLWSQPVEAELDPYYVMRGVGFAAAKPRILFVLDTSGSMSWRATSGSSICDLDECEDGEGSELSRIAAARQAIRSVIEQSHEVAEFGLMTFGQSRPPASSSQVPDTSECYGARFKWVTWYKDYYSGWRELYVHDNPGIWMLCEDNLPYPYIRWDYLGRGSVITADDQIGDVPPSPLIATDTYNFSHWDNAIRPVQWFPQFMGVRINLNNATDPDQNVLNGTYGDYGNNSSNRLAYVWNQDFYYWPYVDGFPGYTFHSGWSPWDGDVDELGIAYQPYPSGASLYAPFFLPDAQTTLPSEDWGPATKEAATHLVTSLTGPMREGGVDVHGGTPWATTIGTVPYSPTNSNAQLSHSTVASYLQFTKNLSTTNVCVPLSAVLLTDGDPSSGEGGSTLHSRLSALRNDIGAKVYVVGFVHSSTSLNNMACAAAGSNSSSDPCNGTPAKDWDTCNNPDNPTGACAYLASDPHTLADTLTKIITGTVELSLTSGPGFNVNEFGVGQEKQYGNEEGTVQTAVAAYSEWPSWRGHVTRSLCENTDPVTGELAPECHDIPFEDDVETFGPCTASRVWDAGVCLQETDWDDRRIYTNDANNTLIAISDENGNATSHFIDQLNSSDLNIPGGPYDQDSADELVEFILGRHGADNWKLPSMAQASPIVIRRVAEKNLNYSPTVGIRDPHCAGRRLSGNLSIPKSLEDFSDAVYTNILESPSTHMAYTEGVLIGDDLGMLHSFHLDSGNELWGLIPRHMLHKSIEAAANGPELMGQNADPEEHIFGLGGTVNHGWVFDPNKGTEGDWRHIAVLGSAKGGNHLMVLDVSHMSPSSPEGPVEILWTSKDTQLHDIFEARLGQTWSRPALSYHVPNDNVGVEPIPILILGSGYPVGSSPDPEQGRTLLVLDALTGAINEEVVLPNPTGNVYESNYAATVDPAVGTHCSSRFWAEAQEVYLPDPAGRLFRWDVAHETEHQGDSGEVWGSTAIPAASFLACQGSDEFACSVAAGNKGDPFHFGAAIMSHNRIDELSGAPSGVLDESYRNNFVVALNSGSIYENKLDPATSDFHASLYFMVDDHRTDHHEGFTIPEDSAKKSEGQHETYWRLAISDFERTRRYQPYPEADWYEETRRFSNRTMPVRAPRIIAERGYRTNPQGEFIEYLDNVEFIYVEFTIFEGPSDSCSPEWYNDEEGEWSYDEGATYKIRGRLVANDGDSFNFLTGSSHTEDAYLNPDRLGFTRNGLEFLRAEQVMEGECADGNCSAKSDSAALRPCDPNTEPPAGTRATSVRLGFQNLSGFSPIEIPQ